MPGQEKLAFPGQRRVEVAVKECALHSVVVYKDRAEVKRVVPARLFAGENEVVISGLASCIDKNSIRVEGQGQAVITEVIYSSETASPSEEEQSSGSQEEYEGLQTELREKERELQHLRFKKEVLRKEKDLLARFADHVAKVHSCKDEGGSLVELVGGGSVAGVMGFFERYEARVAGLDGRLLEAQQEEEQLQEKIKVLRSNMEKANPNTKTTSTETVRSLRVGLEASEATDVTLLVSYVVSNASWTSTYDVRVFTKNKALKVQYYGLIKQSTEEDWENVNISLSTAQPSIGGAAPSLPTRLIRFKRPPPRIILPVMAQERFRAISSAPRGGYVPTVFDSYAQRSEALEDLQERAESLQMNADLFSRSAVRLKRKRGFALGFGGSDSPSPPPSPPALDVDVTQVSAGLFNTTYAIPRTTTIPADNTEHKVTVALVDLEPEFHYTSVPRLSPHSFLQATAKNSSPYTMLAGPANIFLDNNFIAKSELSDVSPNEEFTTSLGADQSIRITCQPISVVHGNTGVLTKSSLATYSHVFEVKNTRTDTVGVQVSEQVPLSTDDRIKVAVAEPEMKRQQTRCPLPYGYAVLNDSNNVEWHTTIPPDEQLELRLVYTVEYPLQDDIHGLPK